jgi:hypothetical protein
MISILELFGQGHAYSAGSEVQERSYILSFLSSNCRCAEAVKQNDVRKASRIIAELRALTSPSGSGAQRMAHYFTDALVKFLPCLCTLLCFSCKSLMDIVRLGIQCWRCNTF